MKPSTPTIGRTIEYAASLVGGRAVGPVEELNRPFDRLACHTAEVGEGVLFVAIPGAHADGHDFVDEAFSRGAVGAVVEDRAILEGRPGIVVSSTRRALSILADALYDQPSRELHLVGVTGTNGKSSVAWWLSHLLTSLELESFCLGTLGVRGRGWSVDGGLTTPDALALHRTLREAVDRDFAAGVMEVSSHALHQSRVHGVQFDVAIFTNLTHDHLDYHGTLEEYFACKKYLFELLASGDSSVQTIVTNGDTLYGREIAEEYGGIIQGECITYGFSPRVSLQAIEIEHRSGETRFAISFQGEVVSVTVPFLGEHNIENVLAVVGGALAFGWPLTTIGEQLPHLPQVPGRLERFSGGEVSAYVDYAHTPDALKRALGAVRLGTEGRVIVVFGCGGDRDRAKRSIMGQIATEWADLVVITSDNPRTEEPGAIIQDILTGCPEPAHCDPDRRAAIRWALDTARAGDAVLIAGKGHEDYQIIGREKFPFSDQEVVREWVRERI